MSLCPHCNQLMPLTPWMDGVYITPTQKKILETVLRRAGISTSDLVQVVWRDDPNGGPSSIKAVHVHVHNLNKRLSGRGVKVVHKDEGYRLLWLDSL